MSYTSKKRDKKKKGSSLSTIIIFIILVVVLVVIAKKTSVLSVLGWVEEPTETKQKKAKRPEKESSEPVISEFERRQAEARERAKQLEEQRIAQEKAHQAELIKKENEEKAFRAWYKPSPECINKNSKWDISVKCGNEYMEAKRYFTEHGLAK